MASALIVSLGLRQFEVFDASTPKGFAQQILITVGVTTVVWLVATFITAPEPMSKLTSFYRSVRPAGSGWTPVAKAAGLEVRTGEMVPNFVNWLLGILLIYATLFAIGELIFGTWARALLLIAFALVAGLAMTWNLNRTGWVGLAEEVEAVPSEVGD
jgi:hypothetical protein